MDNFFPNCIVEILYLLFFNKIVLNDPNIPKNFKNIHNIKIPQKMKFQLNCLQYTVSTNNMIHLYNLIVFHNLIGTHNPHVLLNTTLVGLLNLTF